MTIGQKIKKLRVEKELTQKDVADQLHVTFQTVSKWEKDENEPDISSLRELSRLFGCSMDYLLSEEDVEQKKEVINTNHEPVEKGEPVTKTIIIHQKELHVCERCKKDIPEDELEMEEICVSHARRGRPATYRQAYYHHSCLEEIKGERRIKEAEEKYLKCKQAKKRCFKWSILGGIFSLGIALIYFLNNTQAYHPALGVLFSLLIGYAIFAMIYCILSGSYIGAVFGFCASISIKFPGIIFTWDLDGLAFLVTMKIVFAVLAFIIGLFALAFAIVFSAALGGISFPFVLIHNNDTNYEDALGGLL